LFEVDLHFQKFTEDQRKEVGLERGTPPTGESHGTDNSGCKFFGLCDGGMSEKHAAETPCWFTTLTGEGRALRNGTGKTS